MRTRPLIFTAIIVGTFTGLALSGTGCGDDAPPNTFPTVGGSGGEGGDGGQGGEDPGCSADEMCEAGEVCEQSECIPATCVNDTTDGDETDEDCGGSCLPCNNGAACMESADCESMFCDVGSGAGGGGGAGGAAPEGPGVCAACTTHEDCGDAENTYCNAGACVAQLEPGEACDDNEACASGFCPPDDGVCCNTNCTETCEACTADKTGGEDGTCAAVTAGEDPDTECGDQGAASCGASGLGCNGNSAAPSCVVYDATTVCAAAACMNGEASASWTCDGSGTCIADTPTACTPYACDDAASACQTSCDDHADCDANNYCDTSNNTCVPKIANGNSCSEDAECTSGACPDADGVCCDMACSGTCESCLGALTGGSNGTCAFTTSGTDPEAECPTLQSCNGAGMCSL